MFTYHTQETAPKESLIQMEESKKDFGYVPNFHKVLAEAPATYEIYNRAFKLFFTKTTLTKLEAQVVFMTANFENNCKYCIAGHTWGMKMAKMPDDVIIALREGTPISDKKLEALRSFTKALLKTNGYVGEEKLKEFFDAGYNKRQALEILCGLAAKTISSMANALADTELDEMMKPYEWVHPDKR